MKTTKHLISVQLEDADVDFEGIFNKHDSISFMVYALHEIDCEPHYHAYVETDVAIDCDRIISWIGGFVSFNGRFASVACCCNKVVSKDAALSYLERDESVVTVLKRK